MPMAAFFPRLKKRHNPLRQRQVVYDPHHARHMAAALEEQPFLVRRTDFPAKCDGIPEHRDVDAFQLRNSVLETGGDPQLKIMACCRIARSKLSTGGHDFGVF
jgi:hypothetical protein